MSVARPPAAWKLKLRRTPGGASTVKVIVFVGGLLFILLGLALAALPGPLTIPPILVGLYIWSTEFAWAERLLDRAKRSAHEAWENARRRPVLTALVTVSGLVAFAIGIYLLSRYDLFVRVRELIGLL
ncbi:MAG: PGPGW domain-containing protein [Mycobacteriales bacterium]